MDKIVNREANLVEKEILVEKYKTALKKQQFINEIKSGLGNEIKSNNTVKIIKKSWGQRFLLTIKKIFTKF